jgi:adenylate cyclase
MSLNYSYNLDLPLRYSPNLWAAIILGATYGTLLGLLDWRTEQVIRKNYPLGLIIVVSTVIYGLILVAMLWFLRYIIWDQVLAVYFYHPEDFNINDTSWNYILSMVGIYSLALAPGISFINQMNKKFGHGVLIPLLMGKYRQPQEENRLFMFMDLKSSTTHAENLGHLKYSAMIRDCFMDINRVLIRYQGEIYQYVGDEIVVNWLMIKRFNPVQSVDFFFAVKQRFQSRKEHYHSKYGFLPEFKAGIHSGIVTAVEVGEIKRDIAYHGDTINTAARIQQVCNQYQQSLLISGETIGKTGDQHTYDFIPIGELALRGKLKPTKIFGVQIRNDE